ncbi:hypothetical protein [Cellulomonas sp. URHB0016]
MAHVLGRPWLPWQRQVADVIGERLPDGRYAYPIVVVLVPRQCGKTTFVFDLALGRGLQQHDYRAAYTAQTGHVVTERFGDRFTELEGTLLGSRVRTRRSAGTERITMSGRSYVKAFPPKDGALRGSALDLVVIDEAQEHDELLGAALDRTVLPVFTTRPRRQLMLVGTAGTDASGYLHRYLEAARAGEPGFALFEWGAHDDDDLDDEDVWTARHPGLGTLTDLDMMRTARAAMGAAGFAREFLNVWTRTTSHAIPPDAWRSIQHTTDMPPGRLCLGVDVAADRSAASIAIAGPGRHLELIDDGVDVDAAAARVLELAERHGAPIAIDSVGPVGTVLDELRRLIRPDEHEHRLLVMKMQDVANAAAGFLDDVTATRLSVWPHPALDEAVAAASTRPLGDGFAWSRRRSAGPIAPLVAACAARWGHDHLPPVAPRPIVASA